jgi:hypothetical protein
MNAMRRVSLMAVEPLLHRLPGRFIHNRRQRHDIRPNVSMSPLAVLLEVTLGGETSDIHTIPHDPVEVMGIPLSKGAFFHVLKAFLEIRWVGRPSAASWRAIAAPANSPVASS